MATLGSDAAAPDPAAASSKAAREKDQKEERVLLGTYRFKPSGIARYEKWLGRDVDLGEDFLSPDGCSPNWRVIEGEGKTLDAWAQWVKAKRGRNVVFAVPMLSSVQPGDPKAECWKVDTQQIATELRKGASGAYNKHFERLAHALVSRGLSSAKLRI